jgi:hypothetical protein
MSMEANRKIHYDIRDLSELQYRLNKLGLDVFLIDKYKFPQAFQKCSMKFVVDADLKVLVDALQNLGIRILQADQGQSQGYIVVPGPKRNSSIFIDALQSIPPSGIRKELFLGFKEGWITQWLDAIRENGLLAKVFPELQDCVAIDGGQFHNETVFEHLLASLDAAKGYPPLLQLAVLLHDIGKPGVCKTEKNEQGKIETTFHKHEIIGATIAYNFCKRLHMREMDAQYIVKLVRHHMFRFEDVTTEKTIKRWLRSVGKDAWRDLLAIRIADRKGNKAKAGKPAQTKELKELEDRIHHIIQTHAVIFEEDLNVSKEILRNLAHSSYDLKNVFADLIGVVNSDPTRNELTWLMEYTKRVYGQPSIHNND